jgi:hypothetical protein
MSQDTSDSSDAVEHPAAPAAGARLETCGGTLTDPNPFWRWNMWVGRKAWHAVRRVRRGDDLTLAEVGTLADFLAVRSNRLWEQKREILWLIEKMQLSPEARAICVNRVCDIANPANVDRDMPGRLLRSTVRSLVFILAAFAGMMREQGLMVLFGALAAFGSVPLFVVSLVLESMHLRAIRIQATRTLGVLREPYTIPVLIACVRDLCPGVRRNAIESLPSILHDLPPEPSAISPWVIAAQLAGLLGVRDEALVMSVLGYLERFDNGSAIRAVERQAKRGATPRIRAEAERILPLLWERLRRAQDPSLLVRPANAPEVTPEELLRPAGSGADGDPSTLLRAEIRNDIPS